MLRNFKPSRKAVLICLCVLAGAMSFLSPESAGAVRSKFHWLLAPVGHATMYVATSFKQSTAPQEKISSAEAIKLKKENEMLRRQVETMETQLLTMWSRYHRGRDVYSKLFGPSRRVPVKFIPATVVAGDAIPYGWTRIVNEGTKKGVTNGLYATEVPILHDRSKKLPDNLPVLAGTTIVGRITESGAFTSRLQLLTDNGFEMGGQLRRVINPARPREIRYHARMQPLTPQNNYPVEVFATGDGGKYLKITEVKKIHNIRPGDILQTRPDDLALPAAVPVGQVVSVTDDPKHAGMVEILVKPYADLASLRDVMIVVPTSGVLPPRPTMRRGAR